MKYKDISGQQFGRLTALYKLHNHPKKGNAYWLCVCECGNFAEVSVPNLCSGCTKSCGCLRNELIYENMISKNITHHKTNIKLYSVWGNIKDRCYNKHCHNYQYYGGRGIKICDEWLNDFMTFYNWSMANGYKEGLTIDRIDNNGNYEPTNCRWVTTKQQNRNTRRNKYFTINGETHCLSEWCEIYNLNYRKISSRLRRNWSIEEALELRERSCLH